MTVEELEAKLITIPDDTPINRAIRAEIIKEINRLLREKK